MRFQCLQCNKPFGWTAKKTVSKVIEGYDLPVTMEYVVCPYCESFNFEEYKNGKPQKKNEYYDDDSTALRPANQFDPADLMAHAWKGSKDGRGGYNKASENYGWDFTKEFAEATVDALKSGPLTIGDRTFELKDKIVAMQKVKK